MIFNIELSARSSYDRKQDIKYLDLGFNCEKCGLYWVLTGHPSKEINTTEELIGFIETVGEEIIIRKAYEDEGNHEFTIEIYNSYRE